MNKIYITLLFMASYAHSCPTCIGLPRHNERPFFERKSFLAALEQPKAQAPHNTNPQPNAASKSEEKKQS